jgi:2-methylisocitrate lyase-like PEP mutase family enzyme
VSNVARALLADRGRWPVVAPGVYDVATARIAEAAGFAAVVVSGYAVSATLLGRPDAGYLQLPEIAGVVARIARRTRLALVADSDTGFGNALGAMRATEELIAAGASALFIEDQVSPKRCGHVAGKEVVPAEEFVGKVRAVDRVRRETAPDFVVIARTDARGVAGGSLDEVIRRARLYRDAGADVVFPEGLLSLDEVERCGREVGAPLMYNMVGVSPRLPVADLAAAGVFLLCIPILVLQATLGAAWDVLHGLAKGGPDWMREYEAALASHPAGDVHRFVGFDEVGRLEREYLPAADLAARYDGSLGYRPSGGGSKDEE